MKDRIQRYKYKIQATFFSGASKTSPFNDFDGDGIPDHKDDNIAVDTVHPAKPTVKKNFWKEQPLGRSLSLRNNTWKVVTGGITSLLALVSGLDFVGFINVLQTLEILNNMEILQEILTALVGDLTFYEFMLGLVSSLVVAGISVLVVKGVIKKAYADRLKAIVDETRKSLSEGSEGGKTITDTEKANILARGLSLVELLGEDLFGIDWDLDGDGK